MKGFKSIGLFLMIPLLVGVGFYAGIKTSVYFEQDGTNRRESHFEQELLNQNMTENIGDGQVSEEKPDGEDSEGENSLEAAVTAVTLCVDTKFVLEETDILNHTVVETTQRLPNMYVGMDREQFLQAMEIYEKAPPLSELERGFVSLEVLAFSKERVVVQKNYKFLQPGNGYYLAVYDNEVVVYQENRETIYIETDIILETLPEALQRKIMEMMWIKNEEKLFDFLENYSS